MRLLKPSEKDLANTVPNFTNNNIESAVIVFSGCLKDVKGGKKRALLFRVYIMQK